MAIHGVDGDDYVTLSNQQFLYDQVIQADRILNF
jgi:hypothetical protein